MVSGDLMLQIAGVLFLLWIVLGVLALAFADRRRALWVLLPAPVALLGPLFVAAIFLACAENSGNCL